LPTEEDELDNDISLPSVENEGEDGPSGRMRALDPQAINLSIQEKVEAQME
jgi:hypothetical protein